MVQYDVMTIGNHELYAYGPARWVYDNKDRLSVDSLSLPYRTGR